MRESIRLVAVIVLVGLASSTVRAQLDGDGLDEIARLFGAQSKLKDAVERLGGKFAYPPEDVRREPVGLDFSGSKLADADLAAVVDLLRNSPHLRSLNLSRTAVSDAGLAQLANAPGLTDLNLAETRATDDGVAALLKANPSLQIRRRPKALIYFPDGAEGRHFEDWCSEDLFAMREPSLLALSRDDPKAIVYRLLFVRSFGRPFAIRIGPSDEGATLRAVGLDRIGGYFGGRPVDRKVVKLSREQWAAIAEGVEEARFWRLPADLRRGGIADGSAAVVEAVDRGRYHVVVADIWPRDDHRYRRFQAVAEAILRASGRDPSEVFGKD